MNTFPMLRNQQVRNDGCGRMGMENRERYFWQSRMTIAGNRSEPFEITDITTLARDIRRVSNDPA